MAASTGSMFHEPVLAWDVRREFSPGGPAGAVWIEEDFDFQQRFWLGLEKGVFPMIGDAAKNARRNASPCRGREQSRPGGERGAVLAVPRLLLRGSHAGEELLQLKLRFPSAGVPDTERPEEQL